jgi:uncharacterized membrane protein
MMIDWTWTNIALLIGAAVAVAVLFRWHLDRDNRYDLRDLLLDTVTNRASLDKHILVGFAALSGWVVVVRQLAGKEVETLLLGVLGVFVVQRAAGAAINAYSTRDESRARPEDKP